MARRQGEQRRGRCQGRWWSVTGVVVLAAAVAGAQEPGGVKRADPVVVTATRTEQPLEEVGASVTVVPEDAIQTYQFRTIEEAIRAVPGLAVQRSGSPGKLTTVRIRGASPDQIQVLMDGVRVKSTTTGDFDFANLPVDQIERIEVVRGPGSTVWGADAIGGVINIITKRGRGAPSAYVDLEGGNYETFQGRAGTSGSVGPWSFSLGVSRLDFGGQFANDDHQLTNVNGRVAYALPNQGELSLTGRYTDGRTGIPFKTVFPDFDRNREQTDRLALGSLEWRQPWTAWYEHSLRLAAIQDQLTFRDPPDPGETGPGFRSDIDSTRYEVEWLNFIRPVPIDTVTVGLEFRREKGNNHGTFSESTNTYSVFLQNELRLFDGLFLTAGIRYDDNSAFGDKTTARAALSYLVKETDTRVKASWGQGFRAPTLNELFFPAFPPCGSFGNPNLRPQTSESWDAGAEQHLWRRRIRLAATYFHNDFTDLIQTTLIDPTNFCFQAQNVGRARSQGVEVEGSIVPIDGLVLTANYTYTDTEDLVAHTPLRRFPQNLFSVTAAWEVLTALTLTAEVYVVSNQFEAVGQPKNPGYTVVNAGAQYRLPWKWGPLSEIVLHVRATNLLNESYAETAGFPALGTQVLAGIRASFQ